MGTPAPGDMEEGMVRDNAAVEGPHVEPGSAARGWGMAVLSTDRQCQLAAFRTEIRSVPCTIFLFSLRDLVRSGRVCYSAEV